MEVGPNLPVYPVHRQAEILHACVEVNWQVTAEIEDVPWRTGLARAEYCEQRSSSVFINKNYYYYLLAEFEFRTGREPKKLLTVSAVFMEPGYFGLFHLHPGSADLKLFSASKY